MTLRCLIMVFSDANIGIFLEKKELKQKFIEKKYHITK